MDVIYPRCCGLDVHKREVVACLVSSEPDGTARKEVRAFGTMTPDILALVVAQLPHEVTHVAMESTGSIGSRFGTCAKRASLPSSRIEAVPGRKTDVRDDEWLAELLRHGLLTGSFVPDRPQRELRELTRYRTSLVRERTAEANRLQKTLEGANLKLASVAAILGTSGREILMAPGETEGTALNSQHRVDCVKIPQLERALVGSVGPHQRFLVAEQVAHIDYLDEALPGSAPRSPRACAPRKTRSRGWIPSPASGGRWPRRWWRRSGLTWSGSRPPSIWPRGLGSVPATTRAGASAAGRDAQGQPLAAGLRYGGTRCCSDEGHLPGGAIPTTGGPPRPSEGGCRRCPLHPDHRLPPADGRYGLSRPRGQLLRCAGSAGGGTSPRASSARVGLPRLSGTGRLASNGRWLFSDQAGPVSEPEALSTQSSHIAATDMGSGRRWHDLCHITRLEVLIPSRPSGRSSREAE